MKSLRIIILVLEKNNHQMRHPISLVNKTVAFLERIHNFVCAEKLYIR